MTEDPFGSLIEWGQVIERLQQLKKRGELDDAQTGLIRLICYPDNWRIREQALIAARQVALPTSALLKAIATVLTDVHTHTDARILAAEALGDLAGRGRRAGPPNGFRPGKIFVVLRDQLATPAAPVLHRAVEEAIRKIERSVVSLRRKAGLQTC